MKKIISIVSMLSIATIILFSALAANAQPIAKNNGNVATGAWQLSVNNDLQKLCIQGDNSLPIDIRIINSKGETIYTGKATNSKSDISISGMETGRYNVYLQNGNVRETCKLIIL